MHRGDWPTHELNTTSSPNLPPRSLAVNGKAQADGWRGTQGPPPSSQAVPSALNSIHRAARALGLLHPNTPRPRPNAPSEGKTGRKPDGGRNPPPRESRALAPGESGRRKRPAVPSQKNEIKREGENGEQPAGRLQGDSAAPLQKETLT